jgi:hypothetical protein
LDAFGGITPVKLVYPVCECFDKSITTVGYFSTESSAKDFVNEQDKPCSMSSFFVGEPVRVYDSWSDYRKNSPMAIREKALGKLTEVERKTLGL